MDCRPFFSCLVWIVLAIISRQLKLLINPDFQWRGLMIDVSRHFMPVDVIKRNLDAMSFVKMNVLHLHLSDDQGFRLECKTFPKLTRLGSDGFFYTQAQIKDIISYADDRGIRVIPEFDIPGAFNKLACGLSGIIQASLKNKGNRILKIKLKETGEFLILFLIRLKKQHINFSINFSKKWRGLFPDEYIHIGGDENNGKDWSENKLIQKFMTSHSFKTT